MKILVVDDHELVRDGLRKLLAQIDEPHGERDVIVLEAQIDLEAFAHAKQHPDLGLILLDLCLPDAAGYNTLDALQSLLPECPIVILSGTGDPATMRGALERGAMGFIPKSSTSRVVLSALRLVLSGGIYAPSEMLDNPTQPPRIVRHAREPNTAALDKLRLTRRQAEVLPLVLAGMSNKAISRQLGISPGTVKDHVSAILKALNVSTRIEAAALGLSVGKRKVDQAAKMFPVDTRGTRKRPE